MVSFSSQRRAADLHRPRQNEILEQLNRVYAKKLNRKQRRMITKLKTKFRSTIKDRW